MKSSFTILLWGLLLCGCSQKQASSAVRDIPAPNPRAYKNIMDAKDWRNPYLVIRADGVGLAGRGLLKPDALASALVHLPQSAWPYGTVVGVQEIGIRSGNDDELIRQNQIKVLQVLKDLNINVKFWPSA